VNYISGGPDVNIPQDLTKNIGRHTAFFCLFRSGDCVDVLLNLSSDALQLSKELRWARGWTYGQQNAFRHSYWMASIALKYGDSFARGLGAAHEKDTSSQTLNDVWDSNADRWNNERGIDVAGWAAGQTYLADSSFVPPDPLTLALNALVAQASCECPGPGSRPMVANGQLVLAMLDTDVEG
jgi:hypothetical protein